MTVHQPEFLRAAKALPDAAKPTCIAIGHGMESAVSATDGLPAELLPLHHLAQLFVPGKLSNGGSMENCCCPFADLSSSCFS